MEEFQGNAMPSNSNLGFRVRWHTLAECSTSLLSTKVSFCLSLFIFLCFGPFSRAISPFLISFFFLFFYCKFGSQCRTRGEWRGGKGGLGGSWVFGASLEDDPLFLPAMRSFRPLLRFRAMSSFFLELLSRQATTMTGVRKPESLSNSSSASNMGMTCTPWSSSFSR